MTTDETRQKVKCCSCDGSLEQGVLNVIQTDMDAAWRFPTGGNVITGERNKAIAFLCDDCLFAEKPPSKVVEFTDSNDVIYHPLSSPQVLEQ